MKFFSNILVRQRQGLLNPRLFCGRHASQSIVASSIPEGGVDMDIATQLELGWDPEWVHRLTPKQKTLLPLVLREVEILKNVSMKYTPKIPLEGFLEVLSSDDRLTRLKGYTFHCHKRKIKEDELEERRQKSAEFLKSEPERKARMEKRKKEFLEDNIMHYGLSLNSPFLNMYDSDMESAYEGNLIQAYMFGPTVICDLHWFHLHSIHLKNLLMSQLKNVIFTNLMHKWPAKLQFVNTPVNDPSWKKVVRKHLVHLDPDRPRKKLNKPNHKQMLVDVKAESLEELYGAERDRIVILSPSAWRPLKRFDENDIYVIGGVIDKGVPQLKEATMAYAKKHNLRTARLPIDEHIKWQRGTKSLCLNHVLGSLLDQRCHGDWNLAFNNWLPVRKVYVDEEKAAFRAQITKQKRDEIRFFMDILNLADR